MFNNNNKTETNIVNDEKSKKNPMVVSIASIKASIYYQY